MNRSPIIPLIGTMLGLVGALLTLPPDTVSPGAVRTPAVIFTLGLTIPSIILGIKNGFAEFLRSEWAIVYA